MESKYDKIQAIKIRLRELRSEIRQGNTKAMDEADKLLGQYSVLTNENGIHLNSTSDQK
jgi:hypothetical protein